MPWCAGVRVLACTLAGICQRRISVGHVMMSAAVRQNWVAGRWKESERKTDNTGPDGV